MVVSRSYFFERVFAGPLEAPRSTVMRYGSDQGPVRSIYALESLVNNCMDNSKCDIYFGVGVSNTGKNTKEDIVYTGCAWADIDAKMVGSKKEAYERVWNGDFARPTFLVDSGNGYHAYWCFIKPCFDMEGVEAINRYIADKVGADHCFNINRLLRVPGTINYKDPNQPKPCRILHYSGFVYDHDFFPKQDLVTPKLEAKSAVKFDQVAHHPYSYGQCFITDYTWKKVVEGPYGSTKCIKADGSIDRSAFDFGVAMALVSEGLDNEQIAGLFLSPQLGISSKTLSYDTEYQRRRYLNRTIGRARAVVEGD